MRCALTFGAGNGIIFESSEDFGGAAHRSEALFFKRGICAFSRRSRRRISPLPESDKTPKPDGKSERVCALRPAGLDRAAAMRWPLDSRRLCTTLVPQERLRRRPLRGIFEAVCPLPLPELRPRLGASAGQGVSAEILSRRMSYHVPAHIYPQPRGTLYRAPARIRADGTVHHPYAVPMLYRAHTRTLWRTEPTRCRSRRCSIALLRVYLVLISTVRHGAHRKTMHKRSIVSARIYVPTPTGRPTDEAKDGAARRPSRLPADCQYGRKAVRLRARQSGACGPDWGGRTRFPAAPLSSGRSAGYGRKTAFD